MLISLPVHILYKSWPLYLVEEEILFLRIFPGDLTECYYIQPQAFWPSFSSSLSVCPLLFLLLSLPLSSHVWGIEYVPGGILKRPGSKSPLFPFHCSHYEEAPRLPFDESGFRLINEGKLKDMALFLSVLICLMAH